MYDRSHSLIHLGMGMLDSAHRLGLLPQRIVIVRSLPGLGDLLCLVPALRALRAALPQAEITLLGLSWAKSFVERFSGYLDQWLEFPGYPGIPEVSFCPRRVAAFLTEVQQRSFDLAMQMHGNGSVTNPFTVLLGAQRNAGFFVPGQYCPDGDRFLPYPDHEPEVRRHLRLLEFLGIPLQGEFLEFPIWQTDWQRFHRLEAVYRLQAGQYICVHPGASMSMRRWSTSAFAQVADALAAQGYQVVLTGTASEAKLTQAVAQAMQFPAIDLAGKTNLGVLAALLKQSCLLICNDTGVSHLADALQTKSVVIFSDSDPDRWAPFDRDRHRIVDSRVDSRNAIHQAAGEQVIAQAIDLLQQEYAYAS